MLNMSPIEIINKSIDFNTWDPIPYIDKNPNLKILVFNLYHDYTPKESNIKFFLNFEFNGIFVIVLRERSQRTFVRLNYEVYLYLKEKKSFLHTAVTNGDENFIKPDKDMFMSRFKICLKSFQCNNCKYSNSSGLLSCAVNPLFEMDNNGCKYFSIKEL
jgi:hypothetical protein